MSEGMNYPKRPSLVDAEGSPKMSRKSILKFTGVTEFSMQFDYAMVFGMLDSDEGPMIQSNTAKTVVHAMLNAGLEVFPYLSVQKDELYVLIRAPLAKLKEFADSEDYLLQVDEIALEQTLLAGDAESRIAPIEITDNRDITPLSPYQHIYLEFRGPMDNGLYHVPPGEESPFIKSVRLKLIMAILRAPKKKGGCDLEVNKLLYKQDILALFPLHDRSVTEQLRERCTAWETMPWDCPTHDLKEYFGEKIALYTVFIGHYSLYLIIPAIVGLVFQLIVAATGNFSHPVMAFYSLMITIWAIIMLEYWKRRESYTAMLWGMSEFEKKEQDRPEYHGDLVKSHINGEEILYFPENKSDHLLLFSRSIVTTFIMIVVGVVAGIYTLRFSMQQQNNTNPYASGVASVLNAVQIQVFNLIYQKIVVHLTDNENHRTDTLYEDSMITKLFLFQFINSYSSFFFLGFLATYLPKPNGSEPGHIGQCGATNCMEPLAINLAIIFGTRLVVNNFLDIFLPYLSYRGKLKAETEGVAEDVELSPAEKDYLLVQYKNMIENIGSYADTTIQFGFCMLFVSALPLATLLSLINNWARIKFYTYKLFKFYQRPIPNGAQDIGTWMSIFQFISLAAVVTNGALICFTMDVLWDIFSLAGRIWIFLGFQWGLIAIQFLMQEVIDDVPSEVTIQSERNEFINLKVIEKAADEDFDTANMHKPEEDNVDEGEGPDGPMHCGNVCCCRRPKKLKRVVTRKMRDDLDPYPEMTYPFSSAAGTWPKPLSKDSSASLPVSGAEQKAAAKAAAMANSSYDTSSYAGSVAAVNGPPPPAGAAAAATPAAVAAMPPPPPAQQAGGAVAGPAGGQYAAVPGGQYAALPGGQAPHAPGYI